MAEASEGRKTGIWWDMESCKYPTHLDPCMLLSIPSQLGNQFGTAGPDTFSSAYSCTAYHNSNNQIRASLQQFMTTIGFCITPLPQGSKEEMAKLMMIDVLLWALYNPPPANMVLFMGSLDMSYVIENLRKRGFTIFVATPETGNLYYDNSRCDSANSWTAILVSIIKSKKLPSYLKPNILDTAQQSTDSCNTDTSASIITRKSITHPPLLGIKRPAEQQTPTPVFINKKQNPLASQEQNPEAASQKEEVKKDSDIAGLCNPNPSIGVKAKDSNIKIERQGKGLKIERQVKGQKEELKIVATLDEFNNIIKLMLSHGDFTKGMKLTCLPRLFSQRSGLQINQKKLGYNKLSKLVQACSLLSLVRENTSQDFCVFSSEEGKGLLQNSEGKIIA